MRNNCVLSVFKYNGILFINKCMMTHSDYSNTCLTHSFSLFLCIERVSLLDFNVILLLSRSCWLGAAIFGGPSMLAIFSLEGL